MKFIKVFVIVLFIVLSNESYSQYFDEDFFRFCENNELLLSQEPHLNVIVDKSILNHSDSFLFYSVRGIKVDESSKKIHLELKVNSYKRKDCDLQIFIAKKENRLLKDTTLLIKHKLHDFDFCSSENELDCLDSFDIPIKEHYNLYIYSPSFQLLEFNLDSFLLNRKHDYSVEKILWSCRNKRSISSINGTLKIRNGGRLCGTFLTPTFTEVKIGKDIHIKGELNDIAIPILIAKEINNVLKDTTILGESSYCDSPRDIRLKAQFDIHIPINYHGNLYFWGDEGYYLAEYDIDKFLSILRDNQNSIKKYADLITKED